MDSHSENEILKKIFSLSGSKTIITIAHRLSAVLISDRVALMENGKFNKLFEHQLNNVCNKGGIIN